MPEAIRVDNVCFERNGNTLFRNVSFALEEGESLLITGRSGCGKSALLELCAGLHQPHSGVVRWYGADVQTLSRMQLVEFRKKSGFMFQKHALISNLTIAKNIQLPLRYHERFGERELAERTRALLARFGIESLAHKRPEELSLAELRLAALARSLSMQPRVLFLDEPTAGVDSVTAAVIVRKLRNMRKSHTMSILMVCNTITIMRQMRCPVFILDKGLMIEGSSLAAERTARRVPEHSRGGPHA